MTTLKVIIIPTDAAPAVAEIESTLQAFQTVVGGFIEAVPLPDGSTLWLNEEGKIDGLPFNERATVLTRGILGPTDMVVGNVFITGPLDDEGDNTSVSDALIEELVA